MTAEHKRGERGRFGPGLPRVSDGSLLFLMHLISKMRTDAPSRIGIVLNGSPLFTGNAGSGESEIRRWVLENDWLEGIVALPTDMFYNTGIATYIWLLTNRKDDDRKGRVQLIDASHLWQKMRKSLGSKRRSDERGADRRGRAAVRRRTPRRTAPTTTAPRSRSAAFSTTPISATARSPSSARCVTTTARSRPTRPARRRASRSRTRSCATPRMCGWTRTSTTISSVR